MSRAFDRVWRQLLITKLHDYFSIRGRALPWISDFLWDRSIRVKYNNCLSDPFTIRQGVPQGSLLSPVLFSLYITGIEKVLAKHCEVGIFADDIIFWSSSSDLCYVQNAKYLGYTLDQEITSNKHIESQVIKARKRLNVLKFISGRDWGVEASTLRTTFISLVRPVLEFGIPIYSCASDTNLKTLERVQLCAARIISGLRYSCQIDIVLFESNLPSFSKRRLYSLTRYFNKLYSYNEQHRTSAYLHAWINNRRFMKHSPFSYARTLNLPSSDVEPHSLGFTGAGLELDGIYFHDQLLTSIRTYSHRRGLQCAAQLEDRFQEIWILTDSRASIQHLANWGDIGDQTSLYILSLLHDLSSGHSIHFQSIPSHGGIEGNERADFLARTAAVEDVSPRGNLTFSEISTISKLELNRQIKTPPSHAWYFAKCPGESFRLSSRPLQSTYSRFLSGHIRALRFSNGQKTFPECHWCSSGEASPNHILLCLGFKKDEVLCDPLLFLDFLQIFGFMGIV
ncbi:putative RNA-directed DNA polymerase from transposon BS [Trichonephila clavipes]|nr:putative RNA-directed DNA polymerase from transposon BS [Trichonephila clavipes]